MSETDTLTCDGCGTEFEAGDDVTIVQDGYWDGDGLATYGSDYYHDGCYDQDHGQD